MTSSDTAMSTQNQEIKKEILYFFIKLAFIYFSWKLFSYIVGEQSTPIEDRIWPELSMVWESFNNYVRITLLTLGKWLLILIGYKAAIYNNYILYIPDTASVSVGNYCLAIQLMILYIALVVSVKLPNMIKIISAVLGLIVINLLNVFRIVGVCIIQIYYPDYVTFSHDYFFNIIVLGTIIIMYTWIINRYKF